MRSGTDRAMRRVITMSIASSFATDLAIDLGTANTCVFAHGRGVVLNEPSIVAFNTANGHVEAVGQEAHEMLGRTPPNIRAVRPLRDGVIADFDAAEKMLIHFVKKAMGSAPWRRPRLAIGAGLPVTDAAGNMVIDIGGGTTDIAVISMAGTVYGRSLRVAGDAMDEAIIQYMKRTFNLHIGERTAQQIKFQIGSAMPLEEPLEMDVKGRHVAEGVPRTVTIHDADIRVALSEPLRQIVQAVRESLERVPPELSADIYDRGVVLTGGGALLRNLDRRLSEETGLPVLVAENPLTSVVMGAGMMLGDMTLLRRVSSN